MIRILLTLSAGLFLSTLSSAQWQNPIQKLYPEPMDYKMGIAEIKYIPTDSDAALENYVVATFDKKGNLLSQERYKDGTLFEKKEFTYDEENLLMTESKEWQRKNGLEKEEIRYSYNDKDDVLAAIGYEKEEKTYKIKYAYDEKGNLLSKATYHYDGFDEDIPSMKDTYTYSENGQTVTFISYTHNPADTDEDPFYITRKEITHYISGNRERPLKWSVYTGGINEEPLTFSHKYFFIYNDQEKIGEVKILDDKGELHTSFRGDVYLKLSYNNSGDITEVKSLDPKTEKLRYSSSASYDDNGKVNRIQFETAEGLTRELRISYDGQGNWTHAVQFEEGERKKTEKRLLEYH